MYESDGHGHFIKPTSNRQLLNLLRSPSSPDSLSIAYFDYDTGAWHYQDVKESIAMKIGRPVLLSCYRIANKVSVDWAIVQRLTGYVHVEQTTGYTSQHSLVHSRSPHKRSKGKGLARDLPDERNDAETHKSSTLSTPYSRVPSVSLSKSPSKKSEAWLWGHPAKDVLEKLERFEKDWLTIKTQSGPKDRVDKLFKSVFPGFDGSSSAMNRIRRAAKGLTLEQRQDFVTANETVLYGDVMELAKKRSLNKSNLTDATSSENPPSQEIPTHSTFAPN